MKYLHSYLILTLLLIGALGCGSTENPVATETPGDNVDITVDDDVNITVDDTTVPSDTIQDDDEDIAIPDTVVLDPSEGLGVGSKAPDFELPDSNNQTYSLSDTLTSKNVVIVFYRGAF